MSHSFLSLVEVSERRGPDLVILGNLLVDDIVWANGTTLMGEPGGASTYVSLSARLWGASAGMVSVRGTDYPAATLDELAARGVDLAGVRELGEPGVRSWLLYEERGRRIIHQLGCASHEDVSPRFEDVPPAWLDARVFHVAPMPFERQRELVRSLSARRGSAISLDPHEPVREHNLAAWREVLANVDAFFPNEQELLLDGVADDPHSAMRRLAGGRLRFVALKRGREGGLLFDAKANAFVDWPSVPRLTGDETGAGDAFAGGFLAALIEGLGVEQALDQGVLSTSFSLEDFGPRGLLRATREEAERRRKVWFDTGSRA
jgi:sugar/nucleoside kinase (ribokinase family)